MRWIVRGLSLFGMLVVVLVGLVLLIPSEKVGQIAARELTKATGRTLTLTGSMRPTLWPVLGVKTGAVSIANAGWSDAGPLMLAEGLAIGLDMSALIGGTVRITNIDLLRPQFTLERA
ncbi:MAG: AsmA family protein, partial [Paracoccaceae bacterium]|nr:AsmA family protein [Paracoccaceae bacterium]